jgi:hypothetical protein
MRVRGPLPVPQHIDATPAPGDSTPPCCRNTAMQKLRIGTVGVSGGRAAHAAVTRRPLLSPRQGCSPCSHVHARRERLGFVRRPRIAHFLPPRAKPPTSRLATLLPRCTQQGCWEACCGTGRGSASAVSDRLHRPISSGFHCRPKAVLMPPHAGSPTDVQR